MSKWEFYKIFFLSKWTFYATIYEDRIDSNVREDVETQVEDPDKVFGKDDEVVAQVLNAKEQEVASKLFLLMLLLFVITFWKQSDKISENLLSKVDAEVNTFKISKKIVDEAGNVQEEMCIFHRTRWHSTKCVQMYLIKLN